MVGTNADKKITSSAISVCWRKTETICETAAAGEDLTGRREVELEYTGAACESTRRVQRRRANDGEGKEIDQT